MRTDTAASADALLAAGDGAQEEAGEEGGEEVQLRPGSLLASAHTVQRVGGRDAAADEGDGWVLLPPLEQLRWPMSRARVEEEAGPQRRVRVQLLRATDPLP